MPPEYIDHSDISKKFDVYSLGGVIIRLMDGNKCSTRYSGMGAQEYIKHVRTELRQQYSFLFDYNSTTITQRGQ